MNREVALVWTGLAGFTAFFWLSAFYGLPAAIRAVAGAIQWGGQLLQGVL